MFSVGKNRLHLEPRIQNYLFRPIEDCSYQPYDDYEQEYELSDLVGVKNSIHHAAILS